jgi:hypothetical protein
MDWQITPMRPEDWVAVREIYREGVATGNATLETELPEWKKWDSAYRQDCRFVARNGEQIAGWAALSPVSIRRVYSGVAEVSVFMSLLRHGVVAWANRCSRPWSRNPNATESGPCKPESFPRTVPASHFTSHKASEKLA